eukprot:m51a1_g7131 hypothetical protein (417) ;mRNA; f:241094-258165
MHSYADREIEGLDVKVKKNFFFEFYQGGQVACSSLMEDRAKAEVVTMSVKHIHYNLVVNFLFSKAHDKFMSLLKFTFLMLKSDPLEILHESSKPTINYTSIHGLLQFLSVAMLELPNDGEKLMKHYMTEWRHITLMVVESCQHMTLFGNHDVLHLVLEDEPREQSVYYRLNHALRRRRHRCRVLCPNDNTTAAEQVRCQQQPGGAVGDNGERGEGDEAEAEAEESSWLGYAWRLAEAMRALPVVRGEVYRGVCCPLDAAAYAPGCRVCWNGFTSTSHSRVVASVFAASAVAAAAGVATLFEVRVERGRDVGCLNQYGEAEVLLEPGSAFVVDAATSEGSLLVVRMHEVPSDALLFPAPPADSATTEAFLHHGEALPQQQQPHTSVSVYGSRTSVPPTLGPGRSSYCAVGRAVPVVL